MNSFLKYFLIIAGSVTIGFLLGYSTVKADHIDARTEATDSTSAITKAVNGHGTPVNLNKKSSKKEFFYNYVHRFFRDSAFQMSRITFPLEVTTPINHYDEDTTRMNIGDWTFLKRESYLIVYDRFGCTNCDCDSDEMRIEESGLFNSINYDFKGIDGEWYLVEVYETAELGYQKFR